MQLDIVRQPLSFTLLLLILLLALFLGKRETAPATTIVVRASSTVISSQNLPLSSEGSTQATAPLGALIAPNSTPASGSYCLGIGLLLFFGSLWITRIVTRNRVLVVRTYLPALFFIIPALGFYVPENGMTAALTALLLIIGSDRLIAGFRRKASFDPLFRGAFLIGTTPLLYAPSILFFPLIPIAIILFRRNGKEATVALIGYTLPILIGSYVYWGMGNSFGYLGETLINALIAPSGWDLLTTDIGLWRMMLALMLTILMVFSLISFAGYASQMRTRARRIFLYFIYMQILSSGLFFLPSRSAEMFTLLAVPLAVITPHYFVRHTGFLPALLYLFTILFAIAIRFVPSPF